MMLGCKYQPGAVDGGVVDEIYPKSSYTETYDVRNDRPYGAQRVVVRG